MCCVLTTISQFILLIIILLIIKYQKYTQKNFQFIKKNRQKEQNKTFDL
jgi:hypothetical protein